MATWPNATNTGHTNAPGYPGSLSPAVAVSSGGTYNFIDFDGGLGLNSISSVTFNGCRFRNNGTFNMRMTNCTNIVFNYCSMVPLPAAPPNAAWPSAGAGQPVDGIDAGAFPPYMIADTQGPLYNVRMDGATGCGGIVIDHCDIWGGAIGVDFAGTLDCIVRDCWVHDNRNPIVQDDHSNGTSYVDNLGGRSNISIIHNTIASLGNTNGIGFQSAGTPYSNIIVRENFLSGYGYTLDMCHNVVGNNNLSFIYNVFGTDIRWAFGTVYANFTTQFAQASNAWYGNKLQVLPGSSPKPGLAIPWTAADDGKFVWPDGSLQTADFELDPSPPEPEPSPPPAASGSGYVGAWSGPKRRKRKRDEIEELIDAVIQAPREIVRQTPLSEPQPVPPALVDLMPKMQAVGLTPPQRRTVKRAIVTDDPDDDDEAIELLLNLLS